MPRVLQEMMGSVLRASRLRQSPRFFSGRIVAKPKDRTWISRSIFRGCALNGKHNFERSRMSDTRYRHGKKKLRTYRGSRKR